MTRLKLSDHWRAFLQGYAMSLDLFPVPPRDLYFRDDAEALRSDAEKLAGDMRRAMEKVAAETDTQETGGPND